MINSMTGYGEAGVHEEKLDLSVEIKTVNNRYLKISVRTPEGCTSLESPVESMVRRRIQRGTVSVFLKIIRETTSADYQLNEEVLRKYFDQLKQMNFGGTPLSFPSVVESLLLLPGVVEEPQPSEKSCVTAEFEKLVMKVLEEALDRLDRMRAEEGRNMTGSLKEDCRFLAGEIDRLAVDAPKVTESYRQRLEERIGKVLEEKQLTFEPSDLIREIAVFADKSDVAEELVRFRSHLDQFETILEEGGACGRKLDFLTQEMFREVNTIGSKSSDAAIARVVVDMKGAIERMREMVQNIE